MSGRLVGESQCVQRTEELKQRRARSAYDSTGDRPDRRVVERKHHIFKPCRIRATVRVGKGDDLTFRGTNSRVASGGRASFFLFEEPYSTCDSSLGIRPHESRAVVGGTVVDEKDFEWGGSESIQSVEEER